MSCQEGYERDSPLCAICSEGYFPQLRSCVPCKSPQIWQLVLVVLVLTLVVVLLMHTYRKWSDRVNGLFPYMKVLISFVTIVSTLDTQFGVRWPKSFLSALSVCSALSLDLRMLSGLFCMFHVSYFQNLAFSTMGLMVVVAVAASAACVKPALRPVCTKVAIYILLFAYPVVSVKIVAAFGCQKVDGVHYLREDYAVQCYTAKWRAIALYASIFLAVYVIALPVVVLVKLSRYSQRYRRGDVGIDGLVLGFLLDDYAPTMPAMLWDGVFVGWCNHFSVSYNLYMYVQALK